ncbi:SRPBCC family protein [Zhouia sp. PK063]|uniref:SRPBCC family protein n=1 Tax=Zhouia sp. PK063 TaxID=3373602 RepID=UPI0037B336E2
MKMSNSTNLTNPITVKTTVNATIHKVWDYWTMPEHITQWNTASNDWHTPKAENNLQIGGKFNYRMEAKDGSFGFDFWGIYDEIQPFTKITFTLGDDRKVELLFEELEKAVKITETFEPENQNPVEMQEFGWQAILNNFKMYTETH